MRHLFGTVVAIGVGFACGGAVDPHIDFGEPVFPPPLPGAEQPATTLGLLLPVPEGLIDIGPYSRSTDRTTLVALRPQTGPERSCEPSEEGWTNSVAVPTFRLMEREVSNSDYAQCVSTGACSPPNVDLTADFGPGGAWSDADRATFPVALGYQQARTFCRHYGGDLPTESQWWRAVQGPTRELFGAPFSRDAVACQDANYVRCGLSPICKDACRVWERLKETNGRPALPLVSVLATDYDLGPYGHRHLIGNASEWVRQVDHGRCGYAVPERKFYDDLAVSPTPHCLPSTPLRRVALLSFNPPGDVSGDTVCLDGSGAAEPNVSWFMGFRCAFPTE